MSYYDLHHATSQFVVTFDEITNTSGVPHHTNTVMVWAKDADDAQEQAIDQVEAKHLIHGNIHSIVATTDCD